MSIPTIFEQSISGREGFTLPEKIDTKFCSKKYIPEKYLRQTAPGLPEADELTVVRHYTHLAGRNFSVDGNYYPLGSCTMKYNPKINEELSSKNGFTALHPLQDEKDTQGILEILYNTQNYLCEICGMDEFTLAPFAGAHGEYCGMLLIKAYHTKKGDTQRTKIIIPETAHGTNPASAARCGFDVVEVKSNEFGTVDLNELEKVLDDHTAGIMLTNPNTTGAYEKDILTIAKMVHKAGGLLYYDGANLNAITGRCRPGDMGFDIVHLNLHKTFSTPHGGGGPGSGPVGVKKRLAEFLPKPKIVKAAKGYKLNNNLPHSIGRMGAFYGNIGVIIKAYIYIRMLGAIGMKRIAEFSVLNANYIKKKLMDDFIVPFPDGTMHEFVISLKDTAEENGVRALDFAKRLLDFGIHAPTVYFPLHIKECMLIEPTETESKETLDNFIDVMKKIKEEARTDAEMLKHAPYTCPVKRLDEVKAAKTMMNKQ